MRPTGYQMSVLAGLLAAHRDTLGPVLLARAAEAAPGRWPRRDSSHDRRIGERTMSVLTPKQPTPQGISRLLAKAGFTRRWHGGPGYSVHKTQGAWEVPGIIVCEWAPTGTDISGHRREMLAKYAEVIELAGYAIAESEDGRYLTVTAREDVNAGPS